FVEYSVRTTIARNSRIFSAVARLSTLTLLTVALIVLPVANAVAKTTLSPLTPDAAKVSAKVGDPVELAVSKQIDGKPVSGQSVDWTISGPDSASITPTSSKTSDADADGGAGIARSEFHATAPGHYTVTATTQDNPGCVGDSCATYIHSEFDIRIA